MVSEPNEDRARELLARAAASIDVDGDAPLTLTGLPEPAHRRWPVVLAVAAVVVLLAGVGYVAATQAGDEAAPPVASSDVTSDLPTAPAVRADQIPALLGYTGREAEEALRELGLEVDVRWQPTTCQVDGVFMGSDPAQGTSFEPGDRVVVRVSRARDVIDCVGEPDWVLGWALLRHARGLEGPPPLADDLIVRGPDGEVTELDPALEALAAAAAEVHRVGDRFLQPSLAMSNAACRSGNGPEGPGWVMSVTVPVDGVVCPAVEIRLERDDQGDLAKMWWSANDTEIDSLLVKVPDVIGLDEDDARQTLEDAGFAVAVGDLDGACGRVGRVVTVEPAVGLVVEAGAMITIDVAELCSDATIRRISVSQEFLAWARGDGEAPEFADRVRLFLPGFSLRWTDEPENKGHWDGCSGLGYPDCGINPLVVLDRFTGDVAAVPGPAPCPLPATVPKFGDPDDLIHLAERDPATCELSWSVNLWIDDEGRVYGAQQRGVYPTH